MSPGADDGRDDTTETRDLGVRGVADPAFQNDLLAAWLDDLSAGRARDLAHYQAMFPGREAEVAAEITRLTEGTVDDDAEGGEATAPRIPDVEILEKIGAGGQGVVYRGRQTYIEREVAVKVFAPKFWSAAFAGRFHREAKTLASLRHPNIVACYQAGTTDAGLGFMVMEYVDGPNLRRWLAEHGPMNPRHALLLCKDLARALEHAHDAAIIHRDVKPENVLLRPLTKSSPEALPFEVKLADLGLARVGTRTVGEAAATQLTPIGAVMGSPLTMAPEQFDDPENIDFRADIYGLGCVLFHAIAGRSAFQSTQLTAVIKEKVGTSAPDIRDVEDSVTPEVAAFIRSMMAAEPEARPSSYAEIQATCERCTRDTVGDARRKFLIAGLALLIVPLLAIVAWDPLGIVHAPTVVVMATADPREGQLVTLRATGNGHGGLTYAWSQVDGPPVALSTHRGPVVTFAAPRGLGDHEFAFAVTIANRWRATTETRRVRIHADPQLAPMKRGDTRSLLRTDERKVVEDWRKAGQDVGTWQGAQDHVGANGYCNSGTTRRTRFLPRGPWRLTGAIEPFASAYLRTGMHRTERAGLEFAFSSGDVVALIVQSYPSGAGFVAGVGHRRVNDAATTTLEAPLPGTWTENRPLTFAIEWDGATLRFAYGSKPGAADWVSQRIDARTLPTAYPPNAVTIFVRNGRACFCRLAIEGR